MKIGLITIYQVPNYGSVLQTFASQKVLEQMGHECVIIRYNYRNDEFFKKQGLKRNKFKEWQLNTIPWLKSAKLQSFRKENLNFSKQFETYQELVDFDWSSFDAFIVGSDQVWNTRFLFADPAFLLKFVPDNKTKMSLSSSFSLKVSVRIKLRKSSETRNMSRLRNIFIRKTGVRLTLARLIRMDGIRQLFGIFWTTVNTPAVL